MDQVLVRRGEVTKKKEMLKPGSQEKDENEGNPEAEEILNVKQAAVLPSRAEVQARHKEKILSA